MPEESLQMKTRPLSVEHVCFDMGALSIKTKDVSSDLYYTLGLKGLRKGFAGAPRFLSVLSSLLERSVSQDEKQQHKDQDLLTVFHGTRAPPVSIQQYVERVFKYAGCSPSCFIVAYIYLDRYLQKADAHLCSLNIHRLLITSIMVAAKFLDDAFFNNTYYAKVGGVSTKEMNRMEMSFLFSIDFRLQVQVDTFRKYCSMLEQEASGCQVVRSIRQCWLEESWLKKEDSTTTCTPTSTTTTTPAAGVAR